MKTKSQRRVWTSKPVISVVRISYCNYLNCICACVIVYLTTTEAAYTYYKTLTQEESLVRRGKAAERNRIRRRRERMIRVSEAMITFVTTC